MMYVGIYILVGVFFWLFFATSERTELLRNMMVEKGFPKEQHTVLMFVIAGASVLIWPWTLIHGIVNLARGKSFFYSKIDGVEYN